MTTLFRICTYDAIYDLPQVDTMESHGPITPKCGNVKHATIILNRDNHEPIKLQRMTSRRVPKAVVKFYFPGVYASMLPRFLCSCCISHAKRVIGISEQTDHPSTSSDASQMAEEMEVDDTDTYQHASTQTEDPELSVGSQSKPVDKEKSVEDRVERLMTMITENELDSSQLKRLAGAIGKSVNKKLYDESVELAGHYKSIADLENMCPKAWLGQRNEVVTEFFDRATEVRRKTVKTPCRRRFDFATYMNSSWGLEMVALWGHLPSASHW